MTIPDRIMPPEVGDLQADAAALGAEVAVSYNDYTQDGQPYTDWTLTATFHHKPREVW